MAHTIWPTQYGPHNMAHTIWPTLHGRHYVTETTWPALCGQQHYMANTIWPRLYGRRYAAKTIWQTLHGRHDVANTAWPTLPWPTLHGRHYIDQHYMANTIQANAKPRSDGRAEHGSSHLRQVSADADRPRLGLPGARPASPLLKKKRESALGPVLGEEASQSTAARPAVGPQQHLRWSKGFSTTTTTPLRRRECCALLFSSSTCDAWIVAGPTACCYDD